MALLELLPFGERPWRRRPDFGGDMSPPPVKVAFRPPLEGVDGRGDSLGLGHAMVPDQGAGDILDVRGKLLPLRGVLIRGVPEALAAEGVMLGANPGGLCGLVHLRHFPPPRAL